LAAWGAGLALCAGQAPATLPSRSAPAAPTAAAQTASPDQQLPDALPLGSGDILQISVWKDPDASVPSVVVRPDGMITVPLLKDIQVAGRTPREVEKLISDGLSKYINDPNVTVVVAASNSKKVYVSGAVNKEGPLPYTYRMTVLQALSEAGGLTDYAKRKKIYIIRTENGRDYRLDFNYDEAIKGERMDQNILLQPGDALVVPH
jgi:polysaccharide export outer membrane protein